MAHRWGVQAPMITLPKASSALVTKEAVKGTTKAVLTGERQAMYGLYGCMEKAQTQLYVRADCRSHAIDAAFEN